MQLKSLNIARPVHLPIYTKISVRLTPFSRLSAAELEAWRQLEPFVLDGNPFISPDFIGAAVGHLASECKPEILLIQRGEELIGVGVFEAVNSSRSLPLPHLLSWSTTHTFLDGMWLHRDAAAPAATAMWEYMLRGSHPWHGLEFSRSAQDSATMRILSDTAEAAHISHWNGPSRQRAKLSPSAIGEHNFLQSVSVKRAKSLRKGWRELEKRGTPIFELIGPGGQATSDELRTATEHLLRLEGMGWKAEQGSALNSDARQAAFMREMAASFGARGQLFFSQIRVDDEVIASVAHLVSGTQAFAFKLGWNPDWERGCPGFQLKARIACDAHNELTHLESIDSCASEGSFIEHVWGERQRIGACLFASSIPGRTALNVVQGLRWIKGCLLHRGRKADPSC